MRSIVVLLALSLSVAGQSGFGGEQSITTNAANALWVYATDLDGDGDNDVLSASHGDNKIAWYENLGGGSFGPQQVITTNAHYPTCVYATDLDNDGDADVLSASRNDSKIAWYENVGAGNGVSGGTFGAEQVITTTAAGAHSVYATDLDGDGDSDVVSSSGLNNEVAWYENLGMASGCFGPTQVINTVVGSQSDDLRFAHAADIDNDGDVDVISAWAWGNQIRWHENVGLGNGPTGGLFASDAVLPSSVNHPFHVSAADLDGDGDSDVISSAWYGNEIAWHEHVGAGNGPNGASFATKEVISSTATGGESAYAADMDLDGDLDVLSASQSSGNNKIAWYENTGTSVWVERVIPTTLNFPTSAYAEDLDGDGDPDALTSSYHDNKIAWYENQISGVVNPANGHTYLLTSAQMDFFAARTEAAGMGGYLVSITDAVEQQFIEDKFGVSGYSGCNGHPQACMWIGMSDELTEGNWRWDSGEPFGYTNWDVGEPNNCCGGENYGEIYFYGSITGEWNDSVPTNSNLGIIEIPLPPPLCSTGTCLDLLGTSTIGSPLSLVLQSPAANEPCYVIADTALYGDPAGFAVATVGSTTYYAHLQLGAGVIPLADPSGTFGPSLTSPYTDANGNWSLTLTIPNNPVLVGATFYGEAFVQDFGLLPNGLFHQSNVLTVTIQ